ncbi:MAG: hypothetical protein DI571_12145, partial [Arsenicicoccus sp.]
LGVLAAPLALAGSAPWTTDRTALEVAAEPLPAVAVEQAHGPAALRTLVLRPRGEGLLVDLRGAEAEPRRILRDRTIELAAARPTPQQTRVERTVLSLVGGAPADQAQRELLDLGVGYVLLDADESHPAVSDLDRVSGLTRVSSPPGSVLWRMVDGDPARSRVVDAEGRSVMTLPADGPHGAASGVVDVPEGGALAVAEGAEWAEVARVEVDGAPVPVEDPGRIALPEGRHTVEVAQATPGLPWQVLALALAGIVGFLALPVGRSEDEPQEEQR